MTNRDDVRQRDRLAADLELMLCTHVWDQMGPIRLGGEPFDVLCSDEGPDGFDDDTVLLRRRSDGAVFVADIEVTLSPVSVPEGSTRQ
ncbi:hypothetical protein ABN028_19680 [Actinopolymorpha sp. B17G11]|uniref:hypothetical protein n=1 Tax=Actinopolymorpha sp. B17G11 TaxID=3160861 RepID=UPI0032E3CA07